MAKVIKLKDRAGSLVLPLTRSQLVQMSEITGLSLAAGKTWSKASVQDAIEALMTYATTISESNATALSDITTIKNALTDVLDTQRAVANYVDAQDSAYLALSYAYTDSKVSAEHDAAYTYVGTEVAAALEEAKTYTGTEVAEALAEAKTYTGTEVAAEHAAAYAEAAAKATEAQNNAYAYTVSYVTGAINDLDSTVSIAAADEGKIITGITQTDGKLASVSTAYLNAEDIKRTSTWDEGTHRGIAATDVEGALAELEAAIQVGGTGSVVTLDRYGASGSYTAQYEIKQGGTSLGYIDIPKDMVATDGSLVYGSMSGTTFTPSAGGDPYIEMTIANGDPFYIPVKGLVEYNEFSESDEIGFTDTNHNVTAYIVEVDTDKVKHNGKSVTSYISDINSDIEALEAAYVAADTALKNELLGDAGTSYNTLGKLENVAQALDSRVEALENTSSALSYTVTDDSSYISVTPSTSGGATTFTISTSDIASDTNLQALQTSYNNLNTELTNTGVFYEQVGSSYIDDTTLDTF